MGQVIAAVEHYQQALAIAREIGDLRGEGNSLGNLGMTYRNLGQVKKAIECTEKAFAIFKEIKSPNAERAKKELARLKDISE